MNSSSRAFTLIELLIVISIIAILMSLLVPSMSAAIQTVKIKDTQQRIAVLYKATVDYHRTYGDYPPDRSPDRFSNFNDKDCYPPYIFPDGSQAGYIFRYGDSRGAWSEHPFPGKFLAYFLMGPYGNGWHRPKTTSSSDPNYRMKNISAEWDPPQGLNPILKNSPVRTGGKEDQDHPVFVDAFTLEGYHGGCIGYSRRDPRNNEFYYWAWSSAFYWSVRAHPSYPGDGQSEKHFNKIFKQCSDDFALLSPGPNGKFGYHVYGGYLNGQYLKGYWGDVENGVSDDIGSFPIQ